MVGADGGAPRRLTQGGGSFDGLAATLMRYLGTSGPNGKRAPEPAPSAPTPIETAEVVRDESEPDDDVKP